ncbi:MAG: extracellular solute-binding protein [Chloroflexia bacterium]
MFRRKAFTAQALLLILAMALSACGTEAPTATPIASAPTSTTGAVTTEATATTGAVTTEATATSGSTADDSLSGTVKFWTAYNTVSPEMDTLNNTIIPAFKEMHPNVTVEAQALPYDDLRQKLLTSIAGGEAPDLVRADIIWVPEFAELGALAALDTEMADFDMLKEQVYDGPLQTNFYKGHYYGLPLDTNTRIMFYSDALLAEAGVSGAPKTFDEFKALCDKVKALGKAETYCYAEGGTGAWSILPWIWSNGGDITDAEYTKATGYLNGAATVGAVTMLRDMLKDGTLSPGILGGGIATSDAIGKGQTASILDGPWMPSIFEKQYPDLKLTTAPMPAGAGGSASVVGGEDIVLMQSSQNKEAAIAFMKHMLSEESQIALGKVGQMPVLKSLNGNSELPSYYGVFQTQLLTAKARTPSPNWQKIDDAINTAALSVMLGEKEPQAALDEAAAKVDALLADQ